MKLKLVSPASPVLIDKASEVVEFNQEKDLIKGMLEMCGATQRSKSGKRTMVGLAAPQVGVSKRVIVVDAAADGKKARKQNDFIVVINPKVIDKSASYIRGREGCFSTGKVCGAVARPNWVKVEYFDQAGKKHAGQFTGFTARIFQHEIDHLDGVRFPQRIRNEKYLHWVEKDQFDDYRKNWRTWRQSYSFEAWNDLVK